MNQLSLVDVPDRESDSLEFPAIRIRQPIGDIYVCVISHTDVQRITYFDVRRVLGIDRDVERYLGIQRPLSEKRVEELKRYVTYKDSTFPTSVILAADDDYASYDEESRTITLRNTKIGDEQPSIAMSRVCRVIDGQHRIRGLEGFHGKDFDLSVSLFIGSDISDQAYVFATVNLQQTKVNRSLAYDLFELARTRSPQKTCHNIAVAFDRTPNNPFFHKIKRLGVATDGRNASEETITQATFVSALLPYISNDPTEDRDLMLRNRQIPPARAKDSQKLFLRELFRTERDLDIGRIVEEFFLAVATKWPTAWNSGGQGLILNRTNGFNALMKVLPRAHAYFSGPGQLVTATQYETLFDRVREDDGFFNVQEFRPGTSGESRLRRLLIEKMDLDSIEI